MKLHARYVWLLSCLIFCFGSGAGAQQVETSLPLSQRFTINLAAGVPEYIANAASTSNAPQSQWWFENTKNSTTFESPSFVESSDPAWQQVGLPYDANITRTFINQTSGGGQGSLNGQENWYRLHFKVDPQYAGQKFLLNLEGSHTGVQVFINGTLLPGISAVAADAQATHVVGFVPVVVDLTPFLHTDGVTDNVIAVDVSRGDPWFEEPAFSGAFRFGQAMAGLFRNVYLYVTNPVHIPLNVYSNQKTWGTYVGTVSEVPNADPSATATAASAVVNVQTNVVNESGSAQQVTLTTQIVDAKGNVVVTAPPITQTVPAMTPATFPSSATPMFNQLITVPNPTLWYPNNSTFGKPYMYSVYHIVSVNGVVVDSFQSPLGIRTITWDANFPSFNGHMMYLWGGASRYDYPALGSSVPDEQWWRDMAQIAAQGGNIWRPGHSTSSEEMVEAADAYGIMIDQPSGDGEGYWNASSNPTPDDLQLKQELHRDMIVRDRSHPSILDWEEDNGGMNQPLADELATIETTWDNINPRVQSDRTFNPSYAFMGECDGAGCEAGIKQSNPNNPAFGAEYWDDMGTGRGTQTGTGANTVYAYDFELAFAAPYLDDWRQGRLANAFGMAQWYFAETPGEVSLWAEFQNNPAMQNFVRSLGYSSTDANRFPRLLYYIYQANWTPYSIQPVVHLAHHWNRAYEYTPGTPLQENAFSNCPAVRLLINGAAKDPVTGAELADQVPNPFNIDSHTNLTQNTTVMPGQVHWMVNWAPGTVTAECLDINGNVVSGVSDSRTTAGAENKIVLSVVPEVVKPDGTSFQWTSNGSDAAMVVAQVQDANGNIVPTAADNVTFSVSGPATYMGGTQQLVADPSWTNYFQDAFSQANSSVINGVPFAFFHSPGDPELNFEGGLQKIALRSTFTPGTVTVTATAPGLISGSVQLTSVTPPAPPQSQAPAIIVPPVNTAATAGFAATFTVAASGSGTLSYQWSMGGVDVGTNSPTFTIPTTTLAQNNETVTVMVSSSFGSVTSNPVTLTVDSPSAVAITSQPASQTAVVGQSATLSVVATGSPELNYQWFVNNVQVASGPQNTYTTPVFTTAGTQNVFVIVSNPLGKVQSSTAVLTVNAPVPVSVTTPPIGEIVAANQPVQLTATVAGSAPYTYQWQFTPTGGSATILVSNTQTSNSINFTIPAMSAANVGAYTVTVNNAAGVPVTSSAAQVTLAPPGINLALDRPATSSSSQNACNDNTTSPPLSGAGCLGAENAVDGNLDTRWGSATAGAPPTPPVAGVDPSWLQVDLGSVQAFNTVIINWENASAAQYQIQYTNEDPATNPTWQVATTNNAGQGGTETLTFPTVQARYVRMFGTERNTQFGYSIFEFQVYNVPQCGGSTERYTVNPSNASLVTDNLLDLTWTRTIETDTAQGAQFTGVVAAAFCSSLNMRLPTEPEALSISGNNNASCAFPGVWSTWTSTVDPNDPTETAIVSFNGSTTENVTNNFPGATLCVSGTSAGQPPMILTQPVATTASVGLSGTFSVAATGIPSPTYQWSENGTAIPGATSPIYITPLTTEADNGELFSVAVTNATGTVASNTAVLTVTTAPPAGGSGGSTGGGGTSTNPPPPAPACGNATACTGNGSGPAPTSSNLALNKTATSSANESGSFPAPNAVDGNFNTRWSSAFEDNEWFQVDLGSVQAIGQVIIRWQSAFGTQYLIQTSTDGSTWTTQFTQNNGLGGIDNLTFPTVNARYVRMQGVARATQFGYSFWEFEVYSPVAPTIVTQPVSQTVVSGSMAQFTVVAGGTGPYTYQWMDNGVAMPGATSATYTTPLLVESESGSKFSVVVSNTLASTTSNIATVTVTTPVDATPAVGTANLALNQLATSSGNENDGLGPMNAVDGDLTTRWSSNFADNAWLQVDLGSQLMIDKVVLYWQSAFGAQYEIQVSDDSVNWTTAFTQANGQGGVETLTFPPVIARYIRLQGVKRATQFGYSLFEFQVFGANVPVIVTQPTAQMVTAGSTATFNVVASGTGPFTYQWLLNGVAIPGATTPSYTTPALLSQNNGSVFTVGVTNASGTANSAAAVLTVTSQPPTGPNLALNRTATSSSNESAAFPAQMAVDGNLTTRWSSAAVDPSWIMVDLGSAQTVGQVVLNWQNAFGSQYQIQVSPDSQNWTTVFTQTAGKGGVENLTFAPVTARYVRMFGTQRATQFGYSLFEFQVYGAGNGPTIADEPISQTATAGGTATFTVVAGGNGPFTYQWLLNGMAIAGATSSSYTTPVLAAANTGSAYSVTVSNGSGSITSSSALLTVNAQASASVPTITTQPTSQTETAGSTATFSVVAGGTAPFTYQWLLNGTAISGATSSSYTTPVLAASNTGSSYSVTITNAAGSITSSVATLTVNAAAPTGLPTITTQPANQSAVVGATATFSVVAGGTAPFTYQWLLNGTAISGATASSYTTPILAASNTGGLYSVTVTNAAGHITSTAATLTVVAASPTGLPTITTQPANQSGDVGSMATFTVAAAGTGPFTYQWLLNGTAIPGATSASYTTPVLALTNNGGAYSVTVSNASGPVTSTAATLSVVNYTIFPGFIGVDLNNNTKGAWTNDQIFVTVIGIDPQTGIFSYLTSDGTIVDFTLNDKNAANHLTGPNGQAYGNYSFTLAQSTLLKIPASFTSARAFISLGAPLYAQVNGNAAGQVTGYAGPNPQNNTDPNINTHFDWYEFDTSANTNNGVTQSTIFINTTQVDEFGLPLILDVYASKGTFHQETGITESVAQIDSEFSTEVPAQFQPPTMSNLRILSPAKLSMAANGANANYFANYVGSAWTSYASTPLTISLSGRTFSGTASGSVLTFTEVNPSAAHAGETFVVNEPSTQDILGCAGTMAMGVAGSTAQESDENNVQLQLENQICSATNRGVLATPANWTNVPSYYTSTPANFYSQFWHNHSIGGLAYGFSYDDNNGQSSTIATGDAEHLAFSIGW